MFLQFIFLFIFYKFNLGISRARGHGDSLPQPHSTTPTPINGTSSDAVLFLQLYRTIILNVILCVNRLKIVHFTHAIARKRMRPFQLETGEKYRIVHGRKVDFTPCNFAILASLVQQVLPSAKITYFPPLQHNIHYFSDFFFSQRSVYLFLDRFFNQIMHVSRSYNNFFVAKYQFIFELYAILSSSKKRVVWFPLLLKTRSSAIKNSNGIH